MSVQPGRANCPAHRHDTASAYERYGCRCPDAREANRINRKRRREGRYRPELVDATGAHRRIQALQRLGWPMGELAARLGCEPHGRALSCALQRSRCTRSWAAKVAALFDELCMVPGPSQTTQRRAAAKGWPPPLAWDDIDHDSHPAAAGSWHAGAITEHTVAKAMRGSVTADVLTRAERRSVVHRLSRRDVPVREIARRLDMQLRMVSADRAALGLVRRSVPPEQR